MRDIYLVDTSIIIAASLPDEAANAAAFAFMNSRDSSLHACDIIGVETVNALMKAARRKRISSNLAIDIWKAMWCDFDWADLHPSQPHLDEALHLALKYDAHVYDLLHLLAAKHADGILVTLDDKLITKASSMRLGKYVNPLKG